MSKCKNYQLNIPRFYKFQAFDHMMFGYVNGLRKALPSMTIREAIRLWIESFDIDEELYCFDTARTTYYRILNSIAEIGESNADDIII
jgi:hypothetical protein